MMVINEQSQDHIILPVGDNIDYCLIKTKNPCTAGSDESFILLNLNKKQKPAVVTIDHSYS